MLIQGHLIKINLVKCLTKVNKFYLNSFRRLTENILLISAAGDRDQRGINLLI
jgi:hypothetical protein